MRRTGISTEDCLETLDYRVTDLSFQQRALLTVDPTNEEQIEALIGYRV